MPLNRDAVPLHARDDELAADAGTRVESLDEIDLCTREAYRTTENRVRVTFRAARFLMLRNVTLTRIITAALNEEDCNDRRQGYLGCVGAVWIDRLTRGGVDLLNVDRRVGSGLLE